MNATPKKSLMAVSSLAVLLALGACGERRVDQTVGEKTEPSVSTQAANEVRPENRDPAPNSTVMGAAPDTSATAPGTLGEKIDDAQITAKVNAGFASDSELSAIRIDVDTRDGVVTLTGPAPTAAAKERATEIAKNIKDVKSVNNQLQVKG